MEKIKNGDVGHAIRVFRTAAGIKQKSLAAMVAIQPNSLALIESGRREPSLSLLRSIARALGVPVSLLFWEDLGQSQEEETGFSAVLAGLHRELLQVERFRLNRHSPMKSPQRIS